MKKTAKFILVLLGFSIATVAAANRANASSTENSLPGQCVGYGICFTTAGGTVINGLYVLQLE